MPKFVKEAGRYGVLYCGIHNPKSGPNDPVDFMVRQEDAAKINRIVEKFKFASVEEIASVKADIVQSREGAAPDAADRGVMDKAEQDKLLDDLFAKPVQKEASAPENPTAAKAEPSASKTETAPPSGPTSKAPEKPEKDTSSRERRSVREDLKEIHAERAKKADEAGRASAAPDKAKKPAAKAPRHQQPKPKAPRKPKAR